LAAENSLNTFFIYDKYFFEFPMAISDDLMKNKCKWLIWENKNFKKLKIIRRI
jgi:hypothetical protein